MTRLVMFGGEIAVNASIVSPDVPGGSGGTGTLSRSTGLPRSGAACITCDAGSVSQNSFVTVITGPAVPASTTIYARAYFSAPSSSFPTSSAQILALQSVISARFTSGGKLQLWNESGTPAQIGSDSAATFASNVYYRVELMLAANSSSQITNAELRLDGVMVATASGLAIAVGSAALNMGWVTAPGKIASLSLDDVAVNNGAGAVNNSWCGAGTVVLLKPTADSAVGTGWTLGTGTAISGGTGKTAVSNTPPLGVADTLAGSDVKQIRNAASAANSNYDATMTTYTAAGIGSSDTVNAVQCWVATAAVVVTSAKQGTVGIVSNPAVANVALGAGGTAGAFWSGVLASVYPTGWKWSPGTMTEVPTVTKGTAPVMRITQVTSSTRIAVVCGMFVYVEYSPPSGTTYTKTGNGRENG